MEVNIILAGVGGQGIVSISFAIDMAALESGLHFKQAEVHGMSQRGGAVSSHLRVSDQPLYSDLVPRGRGTLVLGSEPLESLRYIDYLGPDGAVVSGSDPVVNIPDYVDLDTVLDFIGSLPNHTLVPAERLAREAGTARAQNMVLLGAATPFLHLPDSALERAILLAFETKGERVQQANIRAFRVGKAAGEAYRGCLGAGIRSREARALVGRLAGGVLETEAIPLWKRVLTGPWASPMEQLLADRGPGRVKGSPEVAEAVLAAGDAPADRLSELLFQN